LYTLLKRFRHSRAPAVPPGPPPAGPAPGAAPHFASGDAAPGPAATGEAPAAEAAAAAAAGAAAASATAAPLPLSTLPRPGFWVRIGALFIDAVIIGLLLHLVLGWSEAFLGNRLFLLALALYGAVMWKVKGTTVGGIVFDLHVVRLDSRELDWPTVFVRALGCILSLCALGLGFIWIAVDPGKQAWHDKLAGTIVVRLPKGAPLV
jgi:uncharacterized RDD family membrane protein YckC